MELKDFDGYIVVDEYTDIADIVQDAIINSDCLSDNFNDFLYCKGIDQDRAEITDVVYDRSIAEKYMLIKFDKDRTSEYLYDEADDRVIKLSDFEKELFPLKVEVGYTVSHAETIPHTELDYYCEENGVTYDDCRTLLELDEIDLYKAGIFNDIESSERLDEMIRLYSMSKDSSKEKEEIESER